MIKEQEAGMPTAEVCRRHGLSPASFYKFKAKYGDMNVSDTHRLKSLEDENAKLKRLLADTMLDNVVQQIADDANRKLNEWLWLNEADKPKKK